ncbi:hypothetical protein BH20ACT17_BH20ACT17_05930 [soil metagenome]
MLDADHDDLAWDLVQPVSAGRLWKSRRPVPAMSLNDPVIITCAISGALANREQRRAIPYTPQEYAAEARAMLGTRR